MNELHEKLRATLAELHGELAALGEVDPESRSLLEEALRDIQNFVRTSANETISPGNEPVVHRLVHLAERFEESHPTLSGILGSAIDALGRMGI